MSASKSTSILCFGDSLTSGYFRFGTEYHPYALRLQERLQSRYPSRGFAVTVDGVPGDTIVDGSFQDRLASRIEKGEKYDFIVIMGGTNDLGWDHPNDEIYSGLAGLWNKALSSGAKVLALTVPASKYGSTVGTQRIRNLNERILAHREDRFFTADIFALIPWPSEEGEQDRIWDDGLHFTAVGYGMVGDVVAEKIMDLLGQE